MASTDGRVWDADDPRSPRRAAEQVAAERATTTVDLSDNTRMFVADLVTLYVEERDGEDVADALAGARLIALAGIKFDLGNGADPSHMAEAVLDAEVRRGLAARVCQCPARSAHRHGNHPRWGVCEGYYRADVGEVGGRLLCADCRDAADGKSEWATA